MSFLLFVLKMFAKKKKKKKRKYNNLIKFKKGNYLGRIITIPSTSMTQCCTPYMAGMINVEHPS